MTTPPAGSNPQIAFGVCTDPNLPWTEHLEQWLYFEELGFASAWDCDHYQQPSRPNGPYFEGWTLLAALAAKTSRIRIGVLVTSNTFRHPALLAKVAVTVDHISNGRLELGLGAGWFKPEHDNFGLEFPEAAGLVDRFREAVELIDMMLRHDVSTYEGRYYRLQNAPCRPGPIQQPRPPLTLGAHRSRMLRIVAQHADRWSSHGSVDEIRERNELLNQHCAAIGRDPTSIIRSLYAWATVLPADPWSSVDAFLDMVGQYSEVGINEFIVDAPAKDQYGVMERVASEVVSAFR